MTLSTAPNRHLSTEPPQNKEEAVFMFEVGEECQRRALRFLVEVEGMSYGEIVKLAQQHNPNTKVTKNALKYLSSKMKADGEALKTTKQPERLKAANKARKRVVEISTTPVENSEPAIEQVQVVVEESTPTPTPTPTPKPTPTPTPTPSVQNPGSSATVQWADDPRLKGWNGTLHGLAKQIYNREVVNSRSRVRMAQQLAEFKLEIEKSMRAASNNHTKKAGALLEADVKMVEATLQREDRPGIKETMEAVIHEAERIQKFASETLRLLQYTT